MLCEVFIEVSAITTVPVSGSVVYSGKKLA